MQAPGNALRAAAASLLVAALLAPAAWASGSGGAPDLVVERIYFSFSYDLPTGTLERELVAVVANAGDGPAAAFRVALAALERPAAGAPGVVIRPSPTPGEAAGELHAPGLAPGEAATLRLPFSAVHGQGHWPCAPLARFDLTARVDAGEEVTERDEGNNAQTRSFLLPGWCVDAAGPRLGIER